MNAYAQLYPYAVICMAIAASISTIVGGLFCFTTLVGSSREAAREAAAKEAARSGYTPGKVGAADTMPYVMGGTAIFVLSCLAAMIELKIGAWVASIGCS
jgi:hypothetical protein